MSVQTNPPTPGSGQDWPRHAESDLHYAKLGRGDPEVLPNQVGFHAQQAVEKALKGVLVHRQVGFTRTHDLTALVQVLTLAGFKWPTELEDAKNLTPYAVQTRYPGYIAPLTRKELDEAIRLAEGVLAWAKRELGLN
jgi:HEPN domain-containing protein